MDYKQVNIRVTPEEKKVIERLSEKLQGTLADAIMDAVSRRYEEVTLKPLISTTYRLYGQLRLATQDIELQDVADCEKVLEDIIRQAKLRSLPVLDKQANELLEQIDERI